MEPAAEPAVEPAAAPGAAKDKSRFDAAPRSIRGHLSSKGGGIEIDEVLVETGLASAELEQVGPIRIGRIVRDEKGRLGLEEIRLVQGDPKDPILDLSGNLNDVLELRDFAVLAGGKSLLTHLELELAAGELVAFANAEGGVLFLGVADDGTAIGLDDELLGTAPFEGPRKVRIGRFLLRLLRFVPPYWLQMLAAAALIFFRESTARPRS